MPQPFVAFCLVFSCYAMADGVAQTINRRKLVQELYDKKTLHRLLNVQPRAGVVLHDLSNEPETSRTPVASSSQTVEPAPKDKDDTHGKKRKREDEPVPTRTHSVAKKQEVAVEDDDDKMEEKDDAEDEEEEESRYGIPPKKRRRTAISQDVHDVFTSDEDGSDDGSDDEDESSEDEAMLVVHTGEDERRGEAESDSGSTSDSLAEEEMQYEKRTAGTGKAPVKINRKREYWASKGVAEAGKDSP